MWEGNFISTLYVDRPLLQDFLHEEAIVYCLDSIYCGHYIRILFMGGSVFKESLWAGNYIRILYMGKSLHKDSLYGKVIL